MDYVDPSQGDYLYDDRGRSGGLAEKTSFVIAGDLNADPHDGGSHPGAIRQLLDHPLVHGDLRLTSAGAAVSASSGAANAGQLGPPDEDTGSFPRGPGNLRIDYVLPSRDLEVRSGGVFWPTPDELGSDLITASDHRLVWVDVVR